MQIRRMFLEQWHSPQSIRPYLSPYLARTSHSWRVEHRGSITDWICSFVPTTETSLSQLVMTHLSTQRLPDHNYILNIPHAESFKLCSPQWESRWERLVKRFLFTLDALCSPNTVNIDATSRARRRCIPLSQLVAVASWGYLCTARLSARKLRAPVTTFNFSAQDDYDRPIGAGTCSTFLKDITREACHKLVLVSLCATTR